MLLSYGLARAIIFKSCCYLRAMGYDTVVSSRRSCSGLISLPRVNYRPGRRLETEVFEVFMRDDNVFITVIILLTWVPSAGKTLSTTL